MNDHHTLLAHITTMKPQPDIRTGRHVVHNLHVHLVFVTEYRCKAMTDAVLTRCEEIMREVCTDFEADIMQFNGEEDHVHYPPKVQLSKLVNSLKQPRTPVPVGRALLVRLVLRRKLRRGASDRRTAVHRAAKTPRGMS